MEEYEKQNELLKELNKNISTELDDLKFEKLDLNKRLKKKENEIKELHSCIDICKDEIKSLSSQLSDITKSYNSIENKIIKK